MAAQPAPAVTRPPLDPEIALFVERMKRDWARHPPFMSLPLDEARAVAETVRAPWRAGGPAMRDTRDLEVETGAGPLRIRVHDPGAAAPGPALIYLHGGGFTLFSLETHDRLMREYAAAGGFRVVGVEYPLSPEARYPEALDKLVALAGWLATRGDEVGVDPSRLAFGGDSAGANLAVATALRLRDAKSPLRIKALLLNYGGFGGACSDEAEALYGGPAAMLDRAEIEYYYRNYLGPGGETNQDPYARPILAVLEGLPPAFLVIPECDVLSEQSLAMAARMAAAGIEVTSKLYPGATHSFLEAMSVAAVAREAIADGAAWVRARLGG